MSHTNRVKPIMTNNGKTFVVVCIAIGGAIFIIAPGYADGLASLGFGIMLFGSGLLVANQLPIWEMKTRAEDRAALTAASSSNTSG